MYERMLDKASKPNEQDIIAYIGDATYRNLLQFEQDLAQFYDVTKDLKFPFGNQYGWGYKYSHRKKHLCYLFFEKDAFTITIQISGSIKNDILNKLSSSAQTLWANRYPCGDDGGWIHYRILDVKDLQDIYIFLGLRQKQKV